MITKEQAMTHKGEFWHMYMKNADGTPVRCRPNGKCKTWKRQPNAWQLPTKIGIYAYSVMNQFNAHAWCIPANWEVESELFRGVKS